MGTCVFISAGQDPSVCRWSRSHLSAVRGTNAFVFLQASSSTGATCRRHVARNWPTGRCQSHGHLLAVGPTKGICSLQPSRPGPAQVSCDPFSRNPPAGDSTPAQRRDDCCPLKVTGCSVRGYAHLAAGRVTSSRIPSASKFEGERPLHTQEERGLYP